MAHYERRKDENGNYIKFANQNIDLTKTDQNYNLAPTHKEGQAEFIRSRCEQLNAAKRKDLNVMADWVVTTPPSVIESGQTGEFLYHTYNFLAERYGKENVVSAYVHLDEIMPHLHFAFIPVTKDGRVSARDCLNRTELSRFHKELDAYIKLKLPSGYNGDLMTGVVAKNGRNKSVEELKAESAEVEKALKKIEPVKKSFGKIVLTKEAYEFCKQKVAESVIAEQKVKYARGDAEYFYKQSQTDKAKADKLYSENQTLKRNTEVLRHNTALYEEFTAEPQIKPLFQEFLGRRKRKNSFHK